MAGAEADMRRNGVVISVVGPTAAGKTSLAIQLAQALGTEIVSADARQVYRGMAIGTAQPTESEREAVKHHLVDCLDPTQLYSAGMFEADAVPLLTSLCASHGSAVLAGGSGMYLKAALEGLDDLPADLSIRAQLTEALHVQGLSALVQQLRSLDPDHVEHMDIHNPQRVVRALEVCLASGKPFSSFHAHEAKKRPWHLLQVGLLPDRETMRSRIARRTHDMMANGWLDEVRALWPLREENALNTVGYKELFMHLEGTCTLEDAVSNTIIHTQQFAKRQLTWFKRDSTTRWFPFEEGTQRQAMEDCLEFVLSEMKSLSGLNDTNQAPTP
ncbi:MAG: tRNA (adenosine(37)-N6)-dimethylallyltransferase MiaA [Bacteroidetes bacterium]|nr:tRNA (adenosine(37)-N6)-dimethylallyltransferase MiaA [Bacteroidota bacterium]MDA0903107.1 tRNA (adenosine(37)-N6)-dimethylallyltransferase MiaA [Bacteroidota bacterium]MDA1242354.1 tRNA (adenosine(37)-N6)-dimethylallyltransferase MiaA [Bacteroidota bacterium]